MKKKEGFPFEKLKGISKNHLLVAGLIGALFLVIAMPTEPKSSREENSFFPSSHQDDKDAGGTAASSYDDYGKELEKKLKLVLEEMEGVGKVEVMITLKDEGERVVEKDLNQVGQESTEKNGDASRTEQEKQYQEETVFSQQSTDGGAPFVSREMRPNVEGVLVVAKGGGDPKIAKNISDAVLALFPVEVHKIKVVKMN